MVSRGEREIERECGDGREGKVAMGQEAVRGGRAKERVHYRSRASMSRLNLKC